MNNYFIKPILALCVVAMFLSCGPISQVGGIPFNSSVTITAEAASKKIHLKKKSITITVGETYTQKLINKKGETITARNITWKSKNKKIAKIDKNGKVTAIKPGKVTLSAKYKGETYNFSVVVKKAKFAKEKITIRVGETFKQKLKDAKGKSIATTDVTWKSSNKNVVKVSDYGKVTAIKKGNATITATYKGKSYKYKVVVKSTYINLDFNEMDLYEGASAYLKAEYKPTNVKIKWNSNNENVAKVSSTGKVTGIGEGTAKITASFTIGGKTYKESCKVNVKKVRYGSVEGNVTYKYNDYRGHVADVGAQVILIPMDGRAKSLELSVEDEYIKWLLASSSWEEEYGIYSTEVDGRGDFRFGMVPEGEYKIVIISRETTSGVAFDNIDAYIGQIAFYCRNCLSESAATALGKSVGYKKCVIDTIDVEYGYETYVSHDFGITYI
ncbi:MAG: hypothetical protein E7558_05145 [Ruminococcaceae bacterium]|nr:hypothetical protein [Oscillospiraceae bacterium]